MSESQVEGSGITTIADGVETEVRIQVKEVLTSVLLDSGLLGQVVATAVDKRLEAVRPSESLSEEAAKVAKTFLRENLSSLFKDEIHAVVSEEVKKALSSEAVKVMIDDKFRAVTQYLRSDVIPKAVRQALRGSGIH